MSEVWKAKWKSRKFRRTCIAAAAGAALLLTAVIYTACSRSLADQDTYLYKEETVYRGDLYLGVMESGSVEAAATQILYELDLGEEETSQEDTEEETQSTDGEEEETETVSYLEVETVAVVQGQYVQEKAPLLTFTQESMSAVRKRLEADVTEKEAALLEAGQDLQEQLLEAKNKQDSAGLLAGRAQTTYQAQLTQAQEEVNGMSARIQVLTQEIESCQAKLASEELIKSCRETKLAYEQAKNKWEDTGAQNTAAYTSNYSAYLSAKDAYDLMEQQIAQLEETVTADGEEITALQAKIEEGTAGLPEKELEAQQEKGAALTAGKTAEQIYTYTQKALQATEESAQQELEEARAALEEYDSFVGDGTVLAPKAGRILSVNYEPGDSLEQQGEILTFAAQDAYSVSVDVSEEDVAGISVGDSVQVELAAYEEEQVEGTVSAVTTTRTSEHANTVSYPVSIRLEGDPTHLFGGLTAEITFVEDSAEAVLYVSEKAIVEQQGGTYVYVKTDSGEKKLQEVTCGFTNGTQVEIKSGLTEGQTVYIRSKGKAQEAETE